MFKVNFCIILDDKSFNLDFFFLLIMLSGIDKLKEIEKKNNILKDDMLNCVLVIVVSILRSEGYKISLQHQLDANVVLWGSVEMKTI